MATKTVVMPTATLKRAHQELPRRAGVCARLCRLYVNADASLGTPLTSCDGGAARVFIGVCSSVPSRSQLLFYVVSVFCLLLAIALAVRFSRLLIVHRFVFFSLSPRNVVIKAFYHITAPLALRV